MKWHCFKLHSVLRSVRGLTCWGRVIAYRSAGAAPVLIGRLGGQTQRAASCIVNVVVGFFHGGVGEACSEAGLTGHRPRHQAGRVLHVICPVTQWHHLQNNSIYWKANILQKEQVVKNRCWFFGIQPNI